MFSCFVCMLSKLNEMLAEHFVLYKYIVMLKQQDVLRAFARLHIIS